MKEVKNKKINFIIGAIFLLMLVIGGTYAYFQILSTNNATPTTISGTGELVGQATLSTNIEELKLNLTAEIMSKDNIGKSYYATEVGEAVETSEVTEGNGRYTLATAKVTESDVALDCTYSYDIIASVTKAVTDASDEDLKVVITEASGIKTTYTLKSLLNGITHTGKIKKLEHGIDKTLKIEAYIENTSDKQNNLSGNEYTIMITPKSGEEGFSCDVAKEVEYAGYYSIDSNTDITNIPQIPTFYSSSLIKISDDTEIYKEDLIGSNFGIGFSEGDFSLNIDEQMVPYEDNYVTFIGSMQKHEEIAFGLIIHDTPPPIYTTTPLSNFVGVEPGIYIINMFENGVENMYMVLPNNNFKGEYSLGIDTDITNMPKFTLPMLAGQMVKVSDDLPMDNLYGSKVTITTIEGKTESGILDESWINPYQNTLFLGDEYEGIILGWVVYGRPQNDEEFTWDTLNIERGIYLYYDTALLKDIKLEVKERKHKFELKATDDISTKVKVNDGYMNIVKVSNKTPNFNDLQGGIVKAIPIDTAIESDDIAVEPVVITEQSVDSRSSDDALILMEGGIVIVYNATTIDGITFPEPGIYLPHIPEFVASISLSY